jgi:hypothetical protein
LTDITAEDLSEMGLTLKLGTRKKLLSFLQNLGKSSTPTQDGPAATTPSKVYVPASTASTGVYESAATPTAEANIQLVTSASTGVYESAATPTADEASNIQQLVTSASTGVYESATQTEAHIQQLLAQVLVYNVHWGHYVRFSCLLQTDDCVIITCNNKYLV